MKYIIWLLIFNSSLGFAQSGLIVDSGSVRVHSQKVDDNYFYSFKEGLPFVDLSTLVDGNWVVKYLQDTSRIYSSFQLVNGKLNGRVYNYWLSGELMVSDQYQNGIHHGDRFCYNESGTLIYRTSWENGRRAGVWLSFNYKRKLLSIEIYKDGNQVSIEKFSMFRSKKKWVVEK
jgi:hypothetical protein